MTASRPAAPATASLVDRACDAIRARILDNDWHPGHQALGQELAHALGMSRTPVREALIRLQNEGLIEVVPRHGMRVLPLSPADMRDIHEVLTSLEATAAERAAAGRPGAAELEPLERARRDMSAALRVDDLRARAQADEGFHRHLLELSGNRLLVSLVENVWDRAHRARMFTLKLRRKPVQSTRERGGRELTALLERYRVRQV